MGSGFRGGRVGGVKIQRYAFNASLKAVSKKKNNNNLLLAEHANIC